MNIPLSDDLGTFAFNNDELAAFRRDGYHVVRRLADPALLEAIKAVAEDHLRRRIEPFELETELRYPGAPASATAEGGDAIRRLKQAYQRDAMFRQWLSTPGLIERLRQLLGSTVLMPQTHHNCVMTKQPRYSSDSLWHQDIRYWHYSRRELVTAWLALGHEHERNGCLQIIPGSHRQTFSRDQFDDALFFRHDLPENARLIAQRVPIELEPGDVLFFHCRLLHAATRNYEQEPKLAAVFTFRAPDDEPIAGTRSAGMPDVVISSSAETKGL